MALQLQDSKLSELMEDFYTLTGIRPVLFDANGSELLSYPLERQPFCACMRENPTARRLCTESDREAFRICKKSKTLYIYKCHAGLVEAVVPMMEGDRLIGYMMFGQITDNKDRVAFCEEMASVCERYQIETDLSEEIRRIRYKSEKQIRAASKIMEACTEYVRLREIVRPTGREMIDRITHFVETHIREELSVERICSEFGISRTRLYETIHPYIKGGIAAFIRQKRLHHAKHLLQTTKLSITEIADACGFADYNYFLRLFKKEYGISCGKMRQK